MRWWKLRARLAKYVCGVHRIRHHLSFLTLIRGITSVTIEVSIWRVTLVKFLKTVIALMLNLQFSCRWLGPGAIGMLVSRWHQGTTFARYFQEKFHIKHQMLLYPRRLRQCCG